MAIRYFLPMVLAMKTEASRRITKDLEPSAIDPYAPTIWIVDAHGYGKRFIVRAEELLTAFVRWTLSRKTSPLFELALVLARLDHVASGVVNSDHSMM
jgi:hypothetical protein